MVRQIFRGVVFLLQFALAIFIGAAAGIICGIAFAALVYFQTAKGIGQELRETWRKRRLEAAIRKAAA
jgi:hypothetical protein